MAIHLFDAMENPAYYAHIMWREHLKNLVASGTFRTQQSLVLALSKAGFDVTQSSVSRELSSMGVRKVEGCYVPARRGGLPPGVAVHAGFSTTGGPLVVLHTNPAEAPLLSQAIDKAGLPGVLGTIAGDDTVFVACRVGSDLTALSRFVGLGRLGVQA